MTRRAVWRFTTALMAFGVVLLFGSVVTYGKPINAGQGLLCAGAAVFAYVASRLSHTLLSANAAHRRRAARRLIVLAMVPALVLTPSVVTGTPAELHADIVIAGLVWATLSMAYTSFLTHRAIDTERKAAETPSVAPSARPRVRHA